MSQENVKRAYESLENKGDKKVEILSVKYRAGLFRKTQLQQILNGLRGVCRDKVEDKEMEDS